MAKEQVIYLKTTGLNLLKQPENLEWTPEGQVELSECTNCFIDEYGKLSRGLGGEATIGYAGVLNSFHSSTRTFVGLGTDFLEYVNGGLVSRKNNCSGQAVSICIYGGVAYCCDGVSNFSVNAAGVVNTWAFVAKKGAKTTRVFSSPMLHTKSATGFGRVFILNSGIIFYSEPIGPAMFDYANNVIWDANPIGEFACIKGVMVIGTSKNTFSLTGADFTQVVKTPVTDQVIKAKTLCAGFYNELEVICFAVPSGLYAVTPDGKALNLTDGKLPKDFFEDKTFTGASVIDGRYTVYTASECFTIDLALKTLYRQTLSYQAVSGGLAMDDGQLVTIDAGQVTGVSSVSYPALSFGTSLKKGVRYLQVSGYFASTSTWTVTDEYGRESVVVLQATTTSGSRLAKIPVSSVVFGQFISVSFETNGYFKLESLHAVPLLKATRG